MGAEIFVVYNVYRPRSDLQNKLDIRAIRTRIKVTFIGTYALYLMKSVFKL